jgi:N-acetyl-anhydromuramyl-L-alanine amidase AmpD
MAPPPFAPRYAITARYLTKPSKRRSGLPLSPGVKFIVAHDTGNPGSTAAGNVAYYERTRDAQSQSAHLFVDAREIVECIPALTAPPEKAWHVRYSVAIDDQLYGFNANDAALGIEYCYGAGIDADEAYRKYVWVMAYACNQFDLDPERAIVGHYFLDPTRRNDPNTGLAYSRRTYEQLLRDVAAEYRACRHAILPPPPAVPPTAARQGTVTATVRLNIRQLQPSRRAPVVSTVMPGTPLAYVAVTDDGEPVNGNPTWYQDAGGNFFWSGGAQ